MTGVQLFYEWVNYHRELIIILFIILLFNFITIKYYYSKNVFDAQPISKVIYAFILGLFSVIPAYILSLSVYVHFSNFRIISFYAPVVEEISKGLLVIWLARSVEFDSLLDGFFYGAMVGSGFAFAENILYAYIAYDFGGVVSGVLMAILRGVLQILGHPLYTGIFGFGVSGAKLNLANYKFIKLPQSVILHSTWNTIAFLGFIPLIMIILASILILRYEVRKATNFDLRAKIIGYYKT